MAGEHGKVTRSFEKKPGMREILLSLMITSCLSALRVLWLQYFESLILNGYKDMSSPHCLTCLLWVCDSKLWKPDKAKQRPFSEGGHRWWPPLFSHGRFTIKCSIPVKYLHGVPTIKYAVMIWQGLALLDPAPP